MSVLGLAGVDRDSIGEGHNIPLFKMGKDTRMRLFIMLNRNVVIIHWK
jgi:hypothetical protein